MRLDEAITISTIHNDHNPNYTDAQREAAHQLGIEAMKRERQWRLSPRCTSYDLLLGETEE